MSDDLNIEAERTEFEAAARKITHTTDCERERDGYMDYVLDTYWRFWLTAAKFAARRATPATPAGDEGLPPLPDELELRAEFARQHEGRDLKQHRMRGTYLRTDIAALWNQHRRTAKWMASRAGSTTGDAAAEGFKLVSVDRSYDERVKQIIAFNTCNGDLDDKLDAAHQAMLAAAPSPQPPAGDA